MDSTRLEIVPKVIENVLSLEPTNKTINMGLFNLFKKKKDNQEILDKMLSFSTQPLEVALSEIQDEGTFLPFGATLTDGTLQLIVYHTDEEEIDLRAHATTIQKIVEKRYNAGECEYCHIAFDGTVQSPEGKDFDAVHVRVSHQPSNTHQMFLYLYQVVDGQVELLNDGEPIIA